MQSILIERLWVRPDIEEDGDCNEPAVPDIEEDGDCNEPAVPDIEEDGE
jgi:hypothetical protein